MKRVQKSEDRTGWALHPLQKVGNLNVTGSPVGLVVAIGLFIMAWMGAPEARIFILGAAIVGTGIGLVLWWKHR